MKPDYDRIRELEIELGMYIPEPRPYVSIDHELAMECVKMGFATVSDFYISGIHIDDMQRMGFDVVKH